MLLAQGTIAEVHFKVLVGDCTPESSPEVASLPGAQFCHHPPQEAAALSPFLSTPPLPWCFSHPRLALLHDACPLSSPMKTTLTNLLPLYGPLPETLA